jgi:hypothetical protein
VDIDKASTIDEYGVGDMTWPLLVGMICVLR